jgi:hypothetical protein
MPQVPYSGTLQVAPQLEPTPRYTADAMPAAFGVNVWQAVEGLGKTGESVGSEIFARGIAMQDLANHSEAQEADAKYMQQAGELHADFSSKQGKDAVDAYPQYIEDVRKARSGIRDGLSNGMSQKLFDTQSLSTMGRTVFNGAGHAATQNKVYANNSSESRIQAIGDNTLSAPQDDASFRNGLNEVEIEVRSQGGLKGWDEEQVNEAIRQRKSWLWSQRIQGLAKSEPIRAGEMLEDAIKKGEVRGQDIAKLTNLTQNANHTVGARMISHDISTGANGRWGEGQVDIRAAASAIKQIESGGNYNSIGVMTRHGRALGAYQVMEEDLPEYLAKAGLPKMSPKEFLADHAVQDQVFAANFGAAMKKYGNANDAASAWFSGQPLAQAKARNANDSTPTYRGIGVGTYVTRFNAALAKDAPLSAKVDMGQRIAQERTPDDPLMQDVVRDRIETDHNRAKQIQRDDEFQNRQVIETALMGGQNGKIPHTPEELQADSKAAQAWDWLVQNHPATARRYMGVMATHAKGDNAWTDQSLRQYQILKGESSDKFQVADFIDKDILGTNLPWSAKKELINLQFNLKNKAEGDPRVDRAMGWLDDSLFAAGITRTGPNKDAYHQFRGILSDQLQSFAEDNKRPPKEDEVRKMGARLLQTPPDLSKREPGFLWGTRDTPTWKVPVPAAEAEKIRNDPEWAKQNIVPDDNQIQRVYTRKLYQDLYSKSPTVMVPVSR